MPVLLGAFPWLFTLLFGSLMFATDPAGGGGDPDPDPDPDDDTGDTDDKTDDKPLGPSGEKALAEERAARKKAEREARTAARELAALKNAGATDDEKKIAAAREEGKKEALETANRRLVKAEVKSAAAGRLANPELAPKLLDLDDFTVDDDGDVDVKAINKAIDDLIDEYPNLASDAKPPSKRSGGDFGKGGKKTQPKMDDLLRAAAGRTAV